MAYKKPTAPKRRGPSEHKKCSAKRAAMKLRQHQLEVRIKALELAQDILVDTLRHRGILENQVTDENVAGVPPGTTLPVRHRTAEEEAS